MIDTSVGVGWCLNSESLINTDSGKKQISDIRKGDYVYSSKSGRNNSYVKVREVMHRDISNYGNYYYNISTSERSILSTFNHIFITPDGWISAEDLSIGDMIISEESLSEKIVSKKKISAYDQEVWDIALEDGSLGFYAEGILVAGE